MVTSIKIDDKRVKLTAKEADASPGVYLEDKSKGIHVFLGNGVIIEILSVDRVNGWLASKVSNDMFFTKTKKKVSIVFEEE